MKLVLLFLVFLCVTLTETVTFWKCATIDEKNENVTYCYFSTFKDHQNIYFCLKPKETFRDVIFQRQYGIAAEPSDIVSFSPYKRFIDDDSWNFIGLTVKENKPDIAYGYTLNTYTDKKILQFTDAFTTFYVLVIRGNWEGSRNFSEGSFSTNCDEKTTPTFINSTIFKKDANSDASSLTNQNGWNFIVFVAAFLAGTLLGVICVAIFVPIYIKTRKEETRIAREACDVRVEENFVNSRNYGSLQVNRENERWGFPMWWRRSASTNKRRAREGNLAVKDPLEQEEALESTPMNE